MSLPSIISIVRTKSMNDSEKRLLMLQNLDRLCDRLGLEYSEEFAGDQIIFELYRSSDEFVVGHFDELEDMYKCVLLYNGG